MQRRILNQVSSNVTLDGSGNGSLAVPATSAASAFVIFVYIATATLPNVSTVDGAILPISASFGVSADRLTGLYFRGQISGGQTSISFLAGDASTTIGVIYIEYFGIVDLIAISSPGTFSAGSSWLSPSRSSFGTGWSSILVSLVFAESSGVIMLAANGGAMRAQFSPSIGHTIGIEDQEVISTVGSYQTSGVIDGTGCQGLIAIFQTNAPLGETLWARTQL